MSERVVGFTVEGIFNRNNGLQVAFIAPCSEEAKIIFRNETSLHPIECILPQSGSLDASIEPFKNNVKFSNYSFNLVASNEVGEYLFQRSSSAIGELTTDIAASQTLNINLGIPGLTNGSFDEDNNFEFPMRFGNYTGFIYIGNELIYLRNESPSGVYEGLRGRAGTIATDHFEGTRFYTLPSYWVGRRANIFDFSVIDKRFEQRENGVLSDGFKQIGARINIKISSSLRGINNQTINNEPTVIEKGIEDNDVTFTIGFVEDESGNRFFSQQIPSQRIPIARFSSVLKEPNVTTPRWWNLNGSLIQTDSTRSFVNDFILGSPSVRDTIDVSQAELGSGITGNIELEEPIELFCIPNRESSLTPSTVGFNSLSSTITNRYPLLTQAEVRDIYQRHPLAICAALMLSSRSVTVDADIFDILNGNFSLQLRRSFSSESIDEIHDLIQETQNFSVDYLILGWNGVPFIGMNEINNILSTYGFKLGIDNNGFFKFVRIRIIDVDTFDTALQTKIEARPGPLLEFDDGAADRVTSITGTYGSTPWRDGSAFLIDSRGERDLPTNAIAEFGDTQINANTIISLNSLFDIMVTRSAIQDFQVSKIKMRVEDHLVQGGDYSLGSFINLNDIPLRFAWIWNDRGERIEDLPPERFTGQIMGRRYLPMEGIYELEIYFTSDFVAKWRAPSLIVRDSDFNLSADELIITSVGTSFGDEINDRERFTIGDVVRFYFDDGTPWTEDTEGLITDISGDEIRIKGFSGNVDEGVIMELSHIRTTGESGYSNPGLNGRFEVVDNPYVFLSDLTNRLGTGNQPGDKYGG